MLNEALPVGAIVPYAGPVNNPNNPDGAAYPDYKSQAYDLRLEQRGWLPCDGRAVAVARYPQLFRAIGFIYGRKDAGWFLLPDYRGRFLRGVNLDAQGPDSLPRDPQASAREPGAGGGWGHNQVGSVQDDAFQAHEHLYEKAIKSGTGGPGSPVFGLYMTPEAQTDGAVMPAGYTPAITIRQAPETRVKNIYVNFLIRCRSGPQGFHPDF